MRGGKGENITLSSDRGSSEEEVGEVYTRLMNGLRREQTRDFTSRFPILYIFRLGLFYGTIIIHENERVLVFGVGVALCAFVSGA